ncbi:Pleckstrin homology domain-containing family G member 5 [Trichoplax sp. H2]|nr:Pleckstrin homology domain-containing family G member 5 [Trichoplax sp. H2]|eukprot:RDD40514.1 Pleckstrin homology domain-containing family G member 5 [Trichoplax sp. H2]
MSSSNASNQDNVTAAAVDSNDVAGDGHTDDQINTSNRNDDIDSSHVSAILSSALDNAPNKETTGKFSLMSSVFGKKDKTGKRINTEDGKCLKVSWQTDNGKCIQEKASVSKGKTLREVLQQFYEKHDLNFQNYNVYLESSQSALPYTFNSYPLGGCTIHVKAVDEQILKKTKAKQKRPAAITKTDSKDSLTDTNDSRNQSLRKKPDSNEPPVKPPTPISENSGSISKKSGSKLAAIFNNSSKQSEGIKTLADSLEEIESTFEEEKENYIEESYTFLLSDSWRDYVEGSEELNKRQMDHQQAIWELLSTEVGYLRDLKTILQVFQGSLCRLRAENYLQDVEISKLFCNISDVYDSNAILWKNSFAPIVDQLKTTKQPLTLGCAWESFNATIREHFTPYIHYCVEQTRMTTYLKEKMKDSSEFRTFLQWCENRKQLNRLQLPDLLAKPMQRITRYPLLLKAIRKNLDDEIGKQNIQTMSDQVEQFTTKINNAIKDQQEYEKMCTSVSRIEGYTVIEPINEEVGKYLNNFSNLNLTGSMPLICPNETRVIIKEGPLRLKEKDAKIDAYGFLFTDHLLITKQSKSGKRIKVIRQPYLLNKIKVYNLKDSGYFLIIYLSEFNTAVSALALQSTSSEHTNNEWIDAINKSTREYKDLLAENGNFTQLFGTPPPSPIARPSRFRRSGHSNSSDHLIMNGERGRSISTISNRLGPELERNNSFLSISSEKLPNSSSRRGSIASGEYSPPSSPKPKKMIASLRRSQTVQEGIGAGRYEHKRKSPEKFQSQDIINFSLPVRNPERSNDAITEGIAIVATESETTSLGTTDADKEESSTNLSEQDTSTNLNPDEGKISNVTNPEGKDEIDETIRESNGTSKDKNKNDDIATVQITPSGSPQISKSNKVYDGKMKLSKTRFRTAKNRFKENISDSDHLTAESGESSEVEERSDSQKDTENLEEGSNLQKDTENVEERSDLQKDTENLQERSDLQNDTENLEEGSVLQKDAENLQERSDLQKDTENLQERSDLQKDTENLEELSDLQKATENLKERSNLQKDTENLQKRSDLQKDTESLEELSDLQKATENLEERSDLQKDTENLEEASNSKESHDNLLSNDANVEESPEYAKSASTNNELETEKTPKEKTKEDVVDDIRLTVNDEDQIKTEIRTSDNQQTTTEGDVGNNLESQASGNGDSNNEEPNVTDSKQEIEEVDSENRNQVEEVNPLVKEEQSTDTDGINEQIVGDSDKKEDIPDNEAIVVLADDILKAETVPVTSDEVKVDENMAENAEILDTGKVPTVKSEEVMNTELPDREELPQETKTELISSNETALTEESSNAPVLDADNRVDENLCDQSDVIPSELSPDLAMPSEALPGNESESAFLAIAPPPDFADDSYDDVFDNQFPENEHTDRDVASSTSDQDEEDSKAVEVVIDDSEQVTHSDDDVDRELSDGDDYENNPAADAEVDMANYNYNEMPPNNSQNTSADQDPISDGIKSPPLSRVTESLLRTPSQKGHRNRSKPIDQSMLQMKDGVELCALQLKLQKLGATRNPIKMAQAKRLYLRTLSLSAQ